MGHLVRHGRADHRAEHPDRAGDLQLARAVRRRTALPEVSSARSPRGPRRVTGWPSRSGRNGSRADRTAGRAVELRGEIAGVLAEAEERIDEDAAEARVAILLGRGVEPTDLSASRTLSLSLPGVLS